MGGLGCDNMTVILVCFLNSEPYSTLVSKCSRVTSLPISQNKAHHSWAHKRNCILIHKPNGSGHNEECLTFGISPHSKLNDTVSGANTDLDSELASSKERSSEFLKGSPPPDTNGSENVENCHVRERSQSSVNSDGALWGEDDEELTMDLESGVTPIETMV